MSTGPEEFQRTPNTYESVLPIWTRLTVYKDGERLFGPEPDDDELEAGWTVQGARRGQTP